MDAPDLPGRGQVRAERKLVTVLVCEVHGPTEDSDQHQLDDSNMPLAGSLTRVQAEVARHGGLVVEVLGDTVVAVFGVPRTHDDDAERAVRAALALRAAFPSSATGGRVRAGVAW